MLRPVQPRPSDTVQAIGEDLFAIAVDQPFRFPAAFTFVLRAFSTLEGLGKALDPDYKFADVARPYVLELLELEARPRAWSRSPSRVGKRSRADGTTVPVPWGSACQFNSSS